jgi:hypothetical protein
LHVPAASGPERITEESQLRDDVGTQPVGTIGTAYWVIQPYVKEAQQQGDGDSGQSGYNCHGSHAGSHLLCDGYPLLYKETPMITNTQVPEKYTQVP